MILREYREIGQRIQRRIQEGKNWQEESKLERKSQRRTTREIHSKNAICVMT